MHSRQSLLSDFAGTWRLLEVLMVRSFTYYQPWLLRFYMLRLACGKPQSIRTHRETRVCGDRFVVAEPQAAGSVSTGAFGVFVDNDPAIFRRSCRFLQAHCPKYPASHSIQDGCKMPRLHLSTVLRESKRIDTLSWLVGLAPCSSHITYKSMNVLENRDCFAPVGARRLRGESCCTN